MGTGAGSWADADGTVSNPMDNPAVAATAINFLVSELQRTVQPLPQSSDMYGVRTHYSAPDVSTVGRFCRGVGSPPRGAAYFQSGFGVNMPELGIKGPGNLGGRGRYLRADRVFLGLHQQQHPHNRLHARQASHHRGNAVASRGGVAG